MNYQPRSEVIGEAWGGGKGTLAKPRVRLASSPGGANHRLNSRGGAPLTCGMTPARHTTKKRTPRSVAWRQLQGVHVSAKPPISRGLT